MIFFTDFIFHKKKILKKLVNLEKIFETKILIRKKKYFIIKSPQGIDVSVLFFFRVGNGRKDESGNKKFIITKEKKSFIQKEE